MITKVGPGRDFELLPTGLRPHYTIRLHQADTAERGGLLAELRRPGSPSAAITSAIPVRFSGCPRRPAPPRSRRWSAGAAQLQDAGPGGVLAGAVLGPGLPAVKKSRASARKSRLGPAPLRALFDQLRGSAAAPRTNGSWWHGLPVCAIDGTTLDVPDTPGHRARLGKQDNQYATAGYPQIRLVALVACGTRAIIDAVFGPAADGEPAYAARLLDSLHGGMIVLLDRGLSGNVLLAAITGARAEFQARLSASRNPPVLRRLADGSFLSVLGGVKVRIIECQITIGLSLSLPFRRQGMGGRGCGRALSFHQAVSRW